MTTAVNYKSDPESYKHIDFSDKAMSELLDNVIDEVMEDMGIVFPKTDEEVDAILKGTAPVPQRHPDTFFDMEEDEMENGGWKMENEGES